MFVVFCFQFGGRNVECFNKNERQNQSLGNITFGCHGAVSNGIPPYGLVVGSNAEAISSLDSPCVTVFHGCAKGYQRSSDVVVVSFCRRTRANQLVYPENLGRGMSPVLCDPWRVLSPTWNIIKFPESWEKISSGYSMLTRGYSPQCLTRP